MNENSLDKLSKKNIVKDHQGMEGLIYKPVINLFDNFYNHDSIRNKDKKWMKGWTFGIGDRPDYCEAYNNYVSPSQ